MPKPLTVGCLGVYETHLPVRDLQRSVEFYRDRLGLTLASEFPDRGIAFLWVGGKDQGMLGLWHSGSAPLHMVLHFAFRVTCTAMEGACAHLLSEGIAPLGFHGEPVSEPVVIGWMPAVSIYLRDPDGHSVEMLHVLDEPADPGFGVQGWSAWRERPHLSPPR